MVPSASFTNYNKREWFTREKVVPVSSVHFTSGLDAMVINKVQVYFVSPSVYKEIENAKDHGVSILNRLKSENERWGLSVKKLEFYHGSKKLV